MSSNTFINSLSEINACVLIPTYNNHRTISDVLEKVIKVVGDTTILIVNDGSTDDTLAVLSPFSDNIELVSYAENQGKGFALRTGFKKAIELGFENVITIDSDGQHFPEDIPLLVEAAKKNRGAVIMGSRNMEHETVPGKSSFGNKFSNFWFRIETLIKLPDTQTGFRVYPLKPLKKMRLFTKKFELEIEVIVRLAWKGVQFAPVPIRVLYDYDERVSHFRPARDFFRISVLNTILVLGALFYFYPKKFFSWNTFSKIKEEAIKPEESNLRKSSSIAFGLFMGIFPIWGFQLLVGIPLAVMLRLNKVLFVLAANISIPPMIPLIIYGSVLTGQFIFTGTISNEDIWSFSMDDIAENVKHYYVGAVILSILVFLVGWIVSFGLFSFFRRR